MVRTVNGIAALLAAGLCVQGAVNAAEPPAAPGRTFRDCDTCPRMVVVPAGRFVLGSSLDEPERDADESPPRAIEFAAPFAVSAREITRGEYAAFVRRTSHASAGACSIWAGTGWQRTEGKTWRDPGFVQDDSHPVVCINWHDATAYVAWLAHETGRPYRLPSEAEWEYAARGGTRTPYFFGSDPDALCAYDNGHDFTSKEAHPGMAWPPVACRDGFAETAPVGSFKPNPLGLYDVHGNVWEWLADCYVAHYREVPPDGAAVTRADCRQRVYRGGGWSVEKRGRRAANRGRYDADAAYAQLGLRVARALDAVSGAGR
jgi:formylglycine-generating enzyme required for sulfatase activity